MVKYAFKMLDGETHVMEPVGLRLHSELKREPDPRYDRGGRSVLGSGDAEDTVLYRVIGDAGSWQYTTTAAVSPE
jgi:hypothetical protein